MATGEEVLNEGKRIMDKTKLPLGKFVACLNQNLQNKQNLQNNSENSKILIV